ncbi:MAG: hypothetical protein WCA96_00780, partial [Methylocella sp.]
EPKGIAARCAILMGILGAVTGRAYRLERVDRRITRDDTHFHAAQGGSASPSLRARLVSFGTDKSFSLAYRRHPCG